MSGAPWTAEDHARLEQLVAEGLSNREIAAALGRTVNAVHFKRHQRRLLSHPAIKAQKRANDEASALRERWITMLPEMKLRLRADIEALGLALLFVVLGSWV